MHQREGGASSKGLHPWGVHGTKGTCGTHGKHSRAQSEAGDGVHKACPDGCGCTLRLDPVPRVGHKLNTNFKVDIVQKADSQCAHSTQLEGQTL